MKTLIQFLAAASVVSNPLLTNAKDINYARRVLDIWNHDIKQLNSNEVVSTARNYSTGDTHKLYVNNEDCVYVYVVRHNGKLKIASNDYRITQEFMDYINSDSRIFEKFIEKPNIIMKKSHGPTSFEIIPIHPDAGNNNLIIPKNPVNMLQAYEIELHTKSITSVADSTTCCATGTCDNVIIPGGSSGSAACQSCHS